VESVRGGGLDAFDSAGVVVSAAHAFEAAVVAAFDADLQKDQTVLIHLGEQVEFGYVQAVRPGTDGKSDDARHTECLFVEAAELRHRGMGVTKGLKIREVLSRLVVAVFLKFNAALDLFANAQAGIAVGGVEGFVVTEAAASGAAGAVAVGAGKTSIDGYFLKAGAKVPAKVLGCCVEAALVWPGIHRH